MELSNLKVGMKVKITSDTTLLGLGKEKEHKNEVVTVYKIVNGWIYVKENNFVWLPIQLEPITKTKTDSRFVVKVNNIEEGVEALRIFKYSVTANLTETMKSFMNYYSKEKEEDRRTVAFEIADNSFAGWANVDFYKRHKREYGNIYTLAEIYGYNTKEEKTEDKTKFVVALKTVPEVLEAFEMFDYPYRTGDMKGRAESFLRMLRGTNGDKDTLAFAIIEGKYSGWCDLAFYKEHTAEYGRVYTINEIKADKKLKTKMEEKKMKTRTSKNNIPVKKEMKDFTVKIETIEEWVKPHSLGSNPVTDENGNVKGWKTTFVVTTVTTPQGTATVKHKQGNSVKRKGIMYACAKIMAQKNETNKMLYELGNERVELSIYHEILANHAVSNGSFNATYEKYEAIEEYNYAIDCRCKTCGKQFDTPEQAREHEKWHALNRKAKHERYLIRREAREKIAEAQHNEAVAAEIKKLMEAE